MGNFKFKAALGRAFKKHIPAHIVDSLEFTHYQEWKNYKQIQFTVYSKGMPDPWPISLELLLSIRDLFESSDIRIISAFNRMKHIYEINPQTKDDHIYHGITLHVYNANFKKVLRDKKDPYVKPMDRFDLVDEEENDDG